MRESTDVARATSSGNVLPDVNAGEPILVSTSTAIKEVIEKIDLIAHSSAPVLITGESGTGKEIVARLIHAKSDKGHPAVAINCAALPKDVIDNELFGHEREAFTGAVSKRLGCFERAHQSTLFLDEITEMHPQVQAKLLRAIESKKFRRLGGYEDVEVDVRVISATNRHIPEALEKGILRADLYYRLSVVELTLPPLRDRRGDVPLLVTHFLKVFCQKYAKPPQKFSDECIALFEAYGWPGNVRELRNMVESIVLLCPDQTIDRKYLPHKITHAEPKEPLPLPENTIAIRLGTSLEEVERIVILQTMMMAGDNKSKAARILGLSRKALYDKLRQYGSATPDIDPVL
jgi:DNA-binding NtrC family response regulator